jgi:acetylornithine/N-succinyldiaminopimelate aminotransferase
VKSIAAKYPAVFVEVRGQGLMIGLKCVRPNGEVAARLMANGLLTVAAGDNVVRLVPPLIIGDAEVIAAAAIIEKSAAEMAAA